MGKEQMLNSALHGIGFFLAIAALVYLVMRAANHGDAWMVVSASLFGSTLILLYLASTLTHAFHATRASRVLDFFDRFAIYLLIAGTYTPFTLITLRGGWGWSLFGVIWGLAILGMCGELLFRERFPSITYILSLLMGWTIVIAIVPLIHLLSPAVLGWLLFGGLAYSGGVVFYLSQKLFRHALWHLCVLCGSMCHFLAILHVISI